MRQALVYLCISGLFLSGCDRLGSPFAAVSVTEDPPAVSEPILLVEPKPEILDPGSAGLNPDLLDTATTADIRAASRPSAGGASLGSTVASLGDPTKPGLWLETPLVQQQRMGRIEASDGTALTVTLLPIPGSATSGSRISLSAMRGLGVPLTDLPKLKVFAGAAG